MSRAPDAMAVEQQPVHIEVAAKAGIAHCAQRRHGNRGQDFLATFVLVHG